jgi:hypothetical protein
MGNVFTVFEDWVTTRWLDDEPITNEEPTTHIYDDEKGEPQVINFSSTSDIN